MPTQAQINTASPTLTAMQQAQIVTLIRSLARYREQSGYFPGLATKVAAVTSVQAQQLNAALSLIDLVPHSTVALTGGEDAVDYDETRERDWLINYMLDCLYDQPLVRSSVGVAAMTPINAWCGRCGCARYICPCG